MFQETDAVEFKREFSKTVLKTVAAFANTKGGIIYLGIEDDGSISGVDDPDEVMLTAMNAIRNGIKPDATMVAQCESMEMNGKHVVGIHIERGANRPYYLAAKGMRPEGVYVRQGPASFMATQQEIVELLKATGTDSYEDRRSLNQDLTFATLTQEFATHSLPLTEAAMRSLGMVDEYGQYTNLGMLLSDQCSSSIKLARFQGTKRTAFQDRLETSGSLLDQLTAGYAFLEKYNQFTMSMQGLRRIDHYDYPHIALREAFVNAIVHQAYDSGASPLISIMDDRIEFVSHGGLPAGYSLEEFQMDISVLRNPKLAAILYRLELIEAYGTGITRMFEAYEESALSPLFDITANVFKVTLPNRNAENPFGIDRYELGSETAGSNSNAVKDAGSAEAFAEQERLILAVIEGQGPLKRSEIQERFDFSQATLLRILKRLEEKGLVRAEGNTRRRVYRALSQ